MLQCPLQSKSLTKSSLARSDVKSMMKDLDTREKGVDICLLMDGTGSMVCWLTSDKVVKLCATLINEMLALPVFCWLTFARRLNRAPVAHILRPQRWTLCIWHDKDNYSGL